MKIEFILFGGIIILLIVLAYMRSVGNDGFTGTSTEIDWSGAPAYDPAKTYSPSPPTALNMVAYSNGKLWEVTAPVASITSTFLGSALGAPSATNTKWKIFDRFTLFDAAKTYTAAVTPCVYNGAIWMPRITGLGSSLGAPSATNTNWISYMSPLSAYPQWFQTAIGGTAIPEPVTGSHLPDPSCAAGKYSVITGGVCSGTVDTAGYLKALKDSLPSDLDIKLWLGHSGNKKDDSGLSAADIAKLKALANSKKPNESSWPQKYDSSDESTESLKPGFSDCEKYYNCKKADDDDEDDYEGSCLQ